MMIPKDIFEPYFPILGRCTFPILEQSSQKEKEAKISSQSINLDDFIFCNPLIINFTVNLVFNTLLLLCVVVDLFGHFSLGTIIW